MNVLGVDLGNANAKTSRGVKFESRIKNGITRMNDSDIKVIYKGDKYTIGSSDGSLNISKNKHTKLPYKLSLLTAIGKSYDDENIECNIVVGTPIETFNNKKVVDSIKEQIKLIRDERVALNGIEKCITVSEVEVFCESGIVFYDRERFRKEKTLVLDFGGSTVDISYWEGLRLSKYRTYKQGAFTLYEDIIKAVNDKFGSNLSPSVSQHIIGSEHYEIDQDIKNVGFVDNIVNNYIFGLVSYINQYFPHDEANSIQLIGGGAIALHKLIQDEYECAELMPRAEFINAYTFKEVGEIKWKR